MPQYHRDWSSGSLLRWAKVVLRRIVRLGPGYTYFDLVYLGVRLEKHGRNKDAIGVFDRAIRQDP